VSIVLVAGDVVLGVGDAGNQADRGVRHAREVAQGVGFSIFDRCDLLCAAVQKTDAKKEGRRTPALVTRLPVCPQWDGDGLARRVGAAWSRQAQFRFYARPLSA
jgi:hypothetical protein